MIMLLLQVVVFRSLQLLSSFLNDGSPYSLLVSLLLLLYSMLGVFCFVIVVIIAAATTGLLLLLLFTCAFFNFKWLLLFFFVAAVSLYFHVVWEIQPQLKKSKSVLPIMIFKYVWWTKEKSRVMSYAKMGLYLQLSTYMLLTREVLVLPWRILCFYQHFH